MPQRWRRPQLFHPLPHVKNVLISSTLFGSLSHLTASCSSSFMNKRRYYTQYSPIVNNQVCNYSTEAPGFVSHENYEIHKVSCLQHYFKNWPELRENKLTASTFGSAIGFWRRRRAQLWLEKLGAIKPFQGNCATWWNNVKEEEALVKYKLITGNTVSLPPFQVYNKNKKNPDEDWIAASPDGFIEQNVYGLQCRGVLEIKCPWFNGDTSRAYPWKRVPLYCIPHAQGLMEIMDCDWMDLYVWTPNGSSLFRLYRDIEYWELLKIALSDFWWKHVQPARDLCSKSVITNPLMELGSLRPEPRHDLCPSIVCKSKLLVDDSDLLMREIHGELQN